MCPPHDNRPSTKKKTLNPSTKCWILRSVDTSLDLNMFSFLSLFYAGDDLSIYIMTQNTCFVFQTKNKDNCTSVLDNTQIYFLQLPRGSPDSYALRRGVYMRL